MHLVVGQRSHKYGVWPASEPKCGVLSTKCKDGVQLCQTALDRITVWLNRQAGCVKKRLLQDPPQARVTADVREKTSTLTAPGTLQVGHFSMVNGVSFR